jgi:hypothetical protein
MVLVVGLVVGTGGGAAPVVQTVATTGAAGASSAGAAGVAGASGAVTGAIFGSAAPAAEAVIGKGMVAVAEAKAAMASGISIEAAMAGAGTPALVVGGTGGAATTAATTCRNDGRRRQQLESGRVDHWNCPCRRRSMRATHCHMSCYKPIIGEAGNEATLAGPITLAALAAHSKVQRISVGACAASASLPEVEVANTAGERYLLRGAV